jgi:hypothetical protein
MNLLLAEEYLSSADGRFVETLRLVHDAKGLIPLTERWKNDPRPWAKQQMVDYLDLPFDQHGHAPVVKRLFKSAEARGDDEVMAACLAAFDRMTRRVRKMRPFYDRATRSVEQVEELVTPRNTLPSKGTTIRDPMTGKPMTYWRRPKGAARLFRWRTRYYLQRRAWRYLRFMAYKDPARYLRTAAAALRRYTDSDFTDGVHLFDSWGIMHVCFGESPHVDFSGHRASLKEGCTLASLTAKPAFGKAWENKEGAGEACRLIVQSTCRTVRQWAVQMDRALRKQLGLAADLTVLEQLLAHADAEVQAYGVELLSKAEDAGHWPVETWLRLLETQNVATAQSICEIMERVVHPERLDLAQCVTLGCARAVPVARVGLKCLKPRAIVTVADRAVLIRLAGARCEAVGAEIAQWALGILGQPEFYDVEAVCRFFDGMLLSVRFGAWQWLSAPECAAWNDPVLWGRISETPFEDLRLRVVEALARRHATLAPDALTALWISVLLGVHRGGRSKLKALVQVKEAILTDETHAPRLIPVLATAVRSIRGPEARAALSAVVSMIAERPALEPAVAAALPELNFTPLAPAA